MEAKQNPFSVYDFLGYFTPGAVFIYGSILAAAHAKNMDSIDIITDKLSFDKSEIYIPFILLAYVIGHLISFLSSATIERYSIWLSGYPSKYLMGLKHGGFFMVHAKARPKILYKFGRIAVALFLLPIATIDVLLSWIPSRKGYSRDDLDPLIRAIIKRKLVLLLTKHAGLRTPPEEGGAKTHNYFLYAYHYALEYAGNHVAKMNNYVALYGFLRALTFILLMSFWFVFLHIVLLPTDFITAVAMLSFSSSATYLFYLGFVKFYRRYSVEVLMAMAVTVS